MRFSVSFLKLSLLRASIQAITVPKVAFSSNSVPMAEIQTAARNFFGFDALRGSQGSVIEAVCNGKDVLGIFIHLLC